MPDIARLASAAVAALALAFTVSAAAAADPLVVPPDATIEKIVAAQAGKVVTLRTGGGEEITGRVKSVSPAVVHLSELSGKEFFDAVVATDHITAVIVRAR